MVLAGCWVTAEGSLVVTPAAAPSLVAPWAASEDAGRRVVRSSRSAVVTSFDAAAVGAGVDGAAELDDSRFSRTVVGPTLGPVEAEATAGEGGVCVSWGPSEEAGGLPGASGRTVSASVGECSLRGTEDEEGWLEG